MNNDLNYLQVEDKQFRLSSTAWLNNNIMTAAQTFIYKELRDQDYQSLLNVQRRGVASYCAVNDEHIQLLHDESAQWLFIFCSNGKIHICDPVSKHP